MSIAVGSSTGAFPVVGTLEDSEARRSYEEQDGTQRVEELVSELFHSTGKEPCAIAGTRPNWSCPWSKDPKLNELQMQFINELGQYVEAGIGCSRVRGEDSEVLTLAQMYPLLTKMRELAKRLPLLVEHARKKHPEFFDAEGFLIREAHVVSEAERQYRKLNQDPCQRFKSCLSELLSPTGVEPCVVGKHLSSSFSHYDLPFKQNERFEYTKDEDRFVALYLAYIAIDKTCAEHGTLSPPPEMHQVFELMKDLAPTIPALQQCVQEIRQLAQQ